MKKEINFNGKKFSILISSDADESVFHEIFTERDYQKIEDCIKNAQTLIVDIGAHIGLFSLYASALNPNVKILSYEPEEENFKNLKENLKQNRIQNVMPKNLAVAAKEGAANLYISQDSHNHSLDQNAKNIQGSKKVQATTLDKILHAHASCDLIKMDCEGAEFEIIATTSPETFQKIKTLFIEYHEYSEGNSAQNLKKILEKNHFRVRLTPSRYDKRMGFIIAS